MVFAKTIVLYCKSLHRPSKPNVCQYDTRRNKVILLGGAQRWYDYEPEHREKLWYCTATISEADLGVVDVTDRITLPVLVGEIAIVEETGG